MQLVTNQYLLKYYHSNMAMHAMHTRTQHEFTYILKLSTYIITLTFILIRFIYLFISGFVSAINEIHNMFSYPYKKRKLIFQKSHKSHKTV